jgi:glycosyltransferase involved in cell wall biosynthesis
MQTLTKLLADDAARRGWRSIVAHWHGDPPSNTGAEYERLPFGPTLRRWPVALAGLVWRIKPDIVHLHGTTPGSIGAVAARLAGISAIVYTEHSLHRARPGWLRRLRRAAARLPALNIAVSDRVAESLIRDAGVPADRVVVVRHGTPEALPLTPPTVDDQRLVYVAYFRPWKAHLLLLDAFARSERASRARITLIGDGEERSPVADRARTLGIHDRVDFAGHLDDPWSAAHGSWACVHPPVRDAYPFAVLEALMRGLPVIASSVGNIPDVVIPEHTGLLVPPGDVSALAGALDRILGDRALRDRMAAEARSFALANLRLESCFDQHFDLYERLIASSG